MLFKLDLGQINFNSVENALAAQQLAFLATSIAFYHIVTRACAEIKIFFGRENILRLKVHLTPKYFFRLNKSLHLF